MILWVVVVAELPQPLLELLAQLVVAQLVVLQLAIELLWIKDAHAHGTGDVLAGLRRRQVGLDILFKIE